MSLVITTAAQVIIYTLKSETDIDDVVIDALLEGSFPFKIELITGGLFDD